MPGLTAAITGHRPDKLYGYDLKAGPYWELRKRITAALTMFDGNMEKTGAMWTGMALGADQLAALAVLDLKSDGRDMLLRAAVPFPGQESRWPERSRLLYRAILSKCDERKTVSNGPYSAKLMQDRNIYMVDRADYVIAIWDGSRGGTANCVQYARSMDVPIWKIDPSMRSDPAWDNRPDGFIPSVREKRKHS